MLNENQVDYWKCTLSLDIALWSIIWGSPRLGPIITWVKLDYGMSRAYIFCAKSKESWKSCPQACVVFILFTQFYVHGLVQSMAIISCTKDKFKRYYESSRYSQYYLDPYYSYHAPIIHCKIGQCWYFPLCCNTEPPYILARQWCSIVLPWSTESSNYCYRWNCNKCNMESIEPDCLCKPREWWTFAILYSSCAWWAWRIQCNCNISCTETFSATRKPNTGCFKQS